MKNIPTLIETDDLRVNFYTFEGVVQALNGVGVVVEQGETYGLVGESGCGKSVTVRSMMRIVQSPGRIEGGRILIYFNEKAKGKAVDIVNRSEAFMESMRGNDVSMIFQEASTSLNPVLSIGEQVGESFLNHRSPEILRKTIDELQSRIAAGGFFLGTAWRQLQIALFRKEIADHEKFDQWMNDFDSRIYELESATDPKSIREREAIKRWRERLRKTGLLVRFCKKFPFLGLYFRRVQTTVKHEVIELLRSLGIPNPENVAERYPHELSGGMQQRIVIAIALACNPLLLIADEPTSNLDVTIQAQIVDLIQQLKKSVISSVVFITHDLGLVAETCDRVTVMYAGDTCETANVVELFDNPLHPYTQGLMNSVPKAEDVERLETIPGSVPNLIHPPNGCRFHPRCPHAMEICRNQKPPITEFSPGHTVSCHLYPPKEPGSEDGRGNRE